MRYVGTKCGLNRGRVLILGSLNNEFCSVILLNCLP